MPHTLTLLSRQHAYAPGEAVELLVLLGNPGEEVLTVPLPPVGWQDQVVLRVVRPNGEVLGPAEDDGDGTLRLPRARLQVFPGAELAVPFPLHELRLEPTPGWHTATAHIDTFEGRWTTGELRFFIDAPAPTELALARRPGQTEEMEFEVWSLFHGKHGVALQQRRGYWPDPDASSAIRFEPPARMHDLPADAHGLAASEPADAVWTAWLTADSVSLSVWQGVQRVGTLALPAPPGRMLGLLSADDGGMQAVVLDAERRQVWWVQAAPPALPEALLSPQPKPNADPDDVEAARAEVAADRAVVEAEQAEVATDRTEGETDRAEQEEEDDTPPPLPPLAPVLHRHAALPGPVNSGTVARSGANGACLNLAFASQDGEVVELLYGVLGEDETVPWRRLRVPDAFLLPDADPCLLMQPDGIALVALLVRTGTREAPRLGLVRAAFDAAGLPLLPPGSGHFDLGPLSGVPRSGAVIFWRGTEDDAPRVDWCVVLTDTSVVAASGGRSARIATLHDAVFHPLCLLSAASHLAVATIDPDGRIGFVSV